jgi:hypothetical protein
VHSWVELLDNVLIQLIKYQAQMHVKEALWRIEHAQQKEKSLARMIQAAAKTPNPIWIFIDWY